MYNLKTFYTKQCLFWGRISVAKVEIKTHFNFVFCFLKITIFKGTYFKFYLIAVLKGIIGYCIISANGIFSPWIKSVKTIANPASRKQKLSTKASIILLFWRYVNLQKSFRRNGTAI